MKELTKATVEMLERTTWSALQKFEKRIKANPGVPVLVKHRDELNVMWQAYREELKRRDREAASKEEVIFTTFIPNPDMGRGCVREIRRTKNFQIDGWWWSGRAPVQFDAERKPCYSEPFKHFAAINRGALLAFA